MAAQFVRFYVDFYAGQYGRRMLALHDPIAALIAAAPDAIGATFIEGRAVVEGARGQERCLIVPAAPGDRITRALAGCDGSAAAEIMSHALERPISS